MKISLLSIIFILCITIFILPLVQGFFHSIPQLQLQRLIKRSPLDMGLGQNIGNIFKRNSDDDKVSNNEIIIKSSDEQESNSRSKSLLGNIPIKFISGDKEVQAWAFEGQITRCCGIC